MPTFRFRAAIAAYSHDADLAHDLDARISLRHFTAFIGLLVTPLPAGAGLTYRQVRSMVSAYAFAARLHQLIADYRHTAARAYITMLPLFSAASQDIALSEAVNMARAPPLGSSHDRRSWHVAFRYR